MEECESVRRQNRLADPHANSGGSCVVEQVMQGDVALEFRTSFFCAQQKVARKKFLGSFAFPGQIYSYRYVQH